ncbi:14570_t:CDS:1, partial [Gigaspora rosea]
HYVEVNTYAQQIATQMVKEAEYRRSTQRQAYACYHADENIGQAEL